MNVYVLWYDVIFVVMLAAAILWNLGLQCLFQTLWSELLLANSFFNLYLEFVQSKHT
jgi:hypothetical protein